MVQRRILAHEAELYGIPKGIPDPAEDGDALVAVPWQDEMPDEHAAQKPPIWRKAYWADLLHHGYDGRACRICIIRCAGVETTALLCSIF